jgi:hypothetical protein
MKREIYTFVWINKGFVRAKFLFLKVILLEFGLDQSKDIDLAILYRITGGS